jgi:HK97 family phage prohead protease
MENRMLHCVDAVVELRKCGSKRRIEGYAAMFFDPADRGTEFRLSPDMVERIGPTAFDDALAREDDVVGLFNHDSNFPLGRTSAGTLRLTVDDLGLRYSINPPNTTQANDLCASIQRGDIKGSSFAFMLESRSDFRIYDDGDDKVREITSLRLLDVSPVTFPAYTASTSQMRSLFQSHVADQAKLHALERRQKDRLAAYSIYQEVI